MRHGDQKKLAKQIGVSPTYLNDILHGRRSCSKKMAERLETATGIELLAWLYPNRHPNPLIRSDMPEVSNGN